MARIKHYSGVSNQEVIPFDKRPRTLIDSTAQYIQDAPRITDTFRENLVQYNLDAIDESIVVKLKSTRRWIEKGNYDQVVGKTSAHANLNRVQDVLQKLLRTENKYNDTLQVVAVTASKDTSVMIRQLMVQQFNYNSWDNTVIIDGEVLWIEDVKIVLQKDPGVPQIGLPFTAGVTPFRTYDTSRPQSKYTISPSGDYFEVIGVFGAYNYYERTRTVNIATNTITAQTPESFIGSAGMSRPFTRTERVADETTINVISNDGVNRVEKVTRIERFKRFRIKRGSMVGHTPTPNGKIFDFSNADPDIKTTTFEYTIQIRWNDNGTWKEEFIVVDDNSHPAIIGVIRSMATRLDLNFIPRLYFRYDKKWLEDGELYKQSRKYAQKLNYPYKRVQKHLKKDIEKNNKDDLDKISSIYLMFGVNIMGELPYEMKYIFRWFKIYYGLAAQQANHQITDTDIDQTFPGFTLDFGNKLDKLTFGCASINYKKFAGTMGKKGSYHRGKSSINVENPIYGTTKAADGITIYYQVEDNLIESYTVADPYGQIEAFEGHVAELRPEEDKEDAARLLLPIDFDYIEDIKVFKEREALIYACMHLEFTTHFSRKKKWYESGFFKILVVIVTAVISLVTSGAGLSLYGILTSAATSLAITVGVTIAIKVLAKILPLEALKILAIVLAVAALVYGAANFTGLNKAFGILQMKASTLLDMSNQLLGAYNQKALGDFMKEAEEYRKKYRDIQKYKEGARVQRVNTRLDMSTERFRNPIIVGESPSQMVARTVNVSLGLLPIQYISQSVSYALSLPTADEYLNRRMQYEQLSYQHLQDTYSEYHAQRASKYEYSMVGESSWSAYTLSERESEPDEWIGIGVQRKRIGWNII